jgi:hypothetical protein
VIGEVSNQNEINEILSIVKIFLVEERMKYLTLNISAENLIKNQKMESLKKIDNSKNNNRKDLSNFTVRGLN